LDDIRKDDDMMLGAIPVVGDIFDFVWKANKRDGFSLYTNLLR